jgi:FMN phosphatase YigB (HAD superfamily)
MKCGLRTGPKLLALDAMGVIYAEADDGLNLLYPFIVEKHGCRDVQEVIRLYNAASIGRMSSAEFWTSCGIDPALEDEYLSMHRLTDGLLEFLNEMRSRGIELWCLSNDISEWSAKLRGKFGLESYFRGFIISGDVGARKPDPAIYHCLLEKARIRPHNVLFVDDRFRNIETAEAIGICSILFAPAAQDLQRNPHPMVRNFPELLKVLDQIL